MGRVKNDGLGFRLRLGFGLRFGLRVCIRTGFGRGLAVGGGDGVQRIVVAAHGVILRREGIAFQGKRQRVAVFEFPCRVHSVLVRIAGDFAVDEHGDSRERFAVEFRASRRGVARGRDGDVLAAGGECGCEQRDEDDDEQDFARGRGGKRFHCCTSPRVISNEAESGAPSTSPRLQATENVSVPLSVTTEVRSRRLRLVSP